MSDQIVLVEITGYHLASGQVEVLRFCDGLAYRTLPSETPANALFRPFLTDPGWCRIDVYTAPGQYARVTPGECVLDDSSGELGAKLIGYAFDGRSIVVRIGERGAPYPAGYVTVINGTITGQPLFDNTSITFHPADLTTAQSKTLQTVRYAGTNVLPDGVEGLDDLAAKVKPIVWALCSNMTPVLCNTSKLVYQVSIPCGAMPVNVNAVRDGGVAMTAGAAYASMADMMATAPAAGQYRVLANTTDGTYVRTGSSATHGLTCDAAYGAAADRTHAQTWARILTYAGVDIKTISATDIAALDLALPAEVEYASLDEAQVSDALTEVANSAACAWYGDQFGTYRLTQWSLPTGLPVANLTALRTDTIDIEDPIGNGNVAPAYLLNLSYGRNWTTQTDADLGGDASSATDPVTAPGARTGLAARAWLNSQYRTASATDITVQAAYLNAITLELTSLIADPTAAQAFCSAQFAMYCAARYMPTISLWLSADQIDLVRAGSVVRVTQPRWNLGAGRLMRVAGVMIDRQTRKTEITCWG
jgi:hypothetical protein